MANDIQIEGYCLKCKEHRVFKDAKAEWASNGTPATRGKCSVCDGNVYKRGMTPLHEGLEKPAVLPAAKKKKAATKKKGKKGKAAVRRSGRLVIVESPAKAKTIGKYLGKGYTVKSSVGHVRDLLKSRLSVDPENNFQPEYRVPNEKRPLVKELKEAASKAKEIFLATDPDREGEAIAWHVLESAEMEPERTQRVVFHEITKPAVQAAFDTPREIDMQQVDAQQARRILDRLVGYKLSPLLWRKVRGRLSAGRVQSVALRLVVERERAIDAFDPVEYWTVQANVSQHKYEGDKNRHNFIAKWHRFEGKEPVLNQESDVLPHLEALEKATWNVDAIKIGTRQRKPAAPFTTSTMQQEASRKLSFGTQKTMRIAQQLYEGVDIGSADGN
ncbi:MAG: DNA topoisomerase, partial [Anaerolineae bacterium]